MNAAHHQHASHAHGDHAQGATSSQQNVRRLALTLALTAIYMMAEIIGGWLANSLALLADAGHMFSDVAALALSLGALWIARRPATSQRTFGYYRAEILAALANGALLIAISLFIFVEAWHRLREPSAVQGTLMMGIAAGGLLMNLAGLWILNAGKADSLNVHGAWLHVLTDAMGSVGALVAGGLIWAFGWSWADPVTSALIGVLVVYSSWALLREAVAVLMEGSPPGIDVDAVRDAIAGVPGVLGIHDLHVWTIASGLNSLSAHVVAQPGDAQRSLIAQLRDLLRQRFGISHITIQIEPPGFEEHPAI